MKPAREMLDLHAQGGTLRFARESSEYDFWRGWLVSGTTVQRLGGDSIRVIAARFADHLVAPPVSQSEFEGRLIHWALSLGNPHQPLFLYEQGDCLVVLIQAGDDVRMLEPRLVLTPAARDTLIRQLRAILEE